LRVGGGGTGFAIGSLKAALVMKAPATVAVFLLQLTPVDDIIP